MNDIYEPAHFFGKHFTHSDLGAMKLVDASHVLFECRAVAHLVAASLRYKQVSMDHLMLQGQQYDGSLNCCI